MMRIHVCGESRTCWVVSLPPESLVKEDLVGLSSGSVCPVVTITDDGVSTHSYRCYMYII